MRLLIRLGKWLEKRWPEILEVSREDYEAIATDVKAVLVKCQALETRLIAAESKLGEVSKLASDTKSELDTTNVLAANLLKPRSLPDIYTTGR